MISARSDRDRNRFTLSKIILRRFGCHDKGRVKEFFVDKRGNLSIIRALNWDVDIAKILKGGGV